MQNEAVRSEKEDLLAGIETVRNTVRQLETQNQELQRQSGSLERDLVAERAMKEQKIKVRIRSGGYSVLLLCIYWRSYYYTLFCILELIL